MHFVRGPLLKALGRRHRFLSGAPGVASLLLLVAALLLVRHRQLVLAAVILGLIDPLGLSSARGLLVPRLGAVSPTRRLA
jgi:hypothetical protein